MVDSGLDSNVSVTFETGIRLLLTNGSRVSLLAVRVHDLVIFPPSDTQQFWVGGMANNQVTSGEGRLVTHFRIEDARAESR